MIYKDDDDDLDDQEEEFLKVINQSGILSLEGILLGVASSGIYGFVIGRNQVNTILLICVGLIGVYSLVNGYLLEKKLIEVLFDEEEEYYNSGISVNSYSKKPALLYKFVNNIGKHPITFGLSLLVVVIFGLTNVLGSVFLYLLLIPLVFYLLIGAKLSIKLWW